MEARPDRRSLRWTPQESSSPSLVAEGKNPFTLDSKEPTADFFEFLKAEVRYNSLYKKYDAEVVDGLFQRCYQDSRDRYASYVKKANEA